MKIKEVMEQTGLTDRAIRLYIENGLITPENQRSYTGRNNYKFTNKELKQLNQIALLRNVDFFFGANQVPAIRRRRRLRITTI